MRLSVSALYTSDEISGKIRAIVTVCFCLIEQCEISVDVVECQQYVRNTRVDVWHVRSKLHVDVLSPSQSLLVRSEDALITVRSQFVQHLTVFRHDQECS